MIRLLFIVPYPELREKVEYVLNHHPEKKNLNADIEVMTVEETPDIPTEEYDAIIARGYTARKTSEMYTQIPTIGLNISGYDILRALHECCELYHPTKIAICGFSGNLFEAEQMSRVFGVEAKVYTPLRHEEIHDSVDRAIEDGCDAMIGGYSANILAREHGINCVVIRTGEDTINHAIDEAIHTVEQVRHERLIAQMYKTIIYSSKDGVIYVDSKGKILVRNHVIRHMNGDISLQGRPLKEALPYLYKTYKNVMVTGEEDVGRILTIPGTKTTVSVTGIPVIVNKEISGVVINLSDITMIQNLESQIRRKLSERGFKAKYTFSDIQYESQTMVQTIMTAKQYAASDSNVIIVGETGTGKELFAQSIHNASKRKNGPFVAINCAALPENLLESELFGYVEGAFTGTSKGGKMGLFEQAHGGTLFLDEIGEVTTAIQSKLLRVLQEKQVRRIGDNKVIDINVRIISATNKSISKMAEQGKFRKDLMYRLDVLRLFIPPLRNRQNDVEVLFLNLLHHQSLENGIPIPVLDSNALPLLHEYPFLGNIRELKNIVERACALKQGQVITREDLKEALYPQDLEMEVFSDVSQISESMVPLSGVSEQEQICRALEQSGGNKTKAAKLLNMDRSTLWRKIQKYQL
ncbi:MAG: sigma 54-interacting transcriptional regulator [Lachnospiraceae bacterium]|nr:sigma 54-interacting transcriptional regulator [Lachnospiraceae bacterium]